MSEDTGGSGSGSGGERQRPRQLGRGLSALLGDVPPPTAAAERPAARATNTLPIEHLRPGSLQPRRHFDVAELDALAASIAERGILQPILVRPVAGAAGRYEIVAGERRWRAAQKASVHEVPVIIRELDDEQALEVALVENVQRQDLGPIEEAEGYQKLILDFGHTQETLSKAVGKSRSHIANIVRLLQLPEDVRAMVNDGTLSFGHARALLQAEDAAGLARRVAKENLNVRETEKLAKQPRYALGTVTNRIPAPKDRDTADLEEKMSAILGLKVSVQGRGEKGRLILYYDTLEQLDDVLRRLGHRG
jgi:ParB family chromosome partitioning protein